MAPNTRLLFLWSIHFDLMKKKAEVKYPRGSWLNEKRRNSEARNSHAPTNKRVP